jgi:fucose 4-O-acetylase-like acetyltransferase
MERPSLLTRDESSAIKGLLMLLIVFGHSGMITTNFATGGKTFFWHWLYSFHVYVFLILPFIYGYHRLDETGKQKGLRSIAKDLKHNLIKIGVPYCWFFLFSAIIFVVIGGGTMNLKGMLYAFVFGNEPLMDKYIGFNFIWFLPAMLALMTLKSVWYNSKPIVRWVIVFVSIALWVLAITKVVSCYTVGMYIPFAISQAFYFILLGLLARWLTEKQFLAQWQMPVVLFLIGVCTVLLYYRKNLVGSMLNVSTILRLVMPVLVFLLLYGMRNLLSKSKLLKFIGTYSLQIYLVHVYVINALSVLFLHFTRESVGIGVVIYVLTLLISIGLALVMVKVPIINKVLFPRELKD